MKTCPKCRREYDVSMSFCLDDGAELLYGPAGAIPDSETATAILHDTPSRGEGKTRLFEPVAANATVWKKKSIIVGTLGIVLVTALGIASYWYVGRTSSKQIDSIAVMPFVNESGNPEFEYLSDGMTETLISSLSKIPNLSVKARSTVFFYKDKEITPASIGTELGVQAVLLGRVVQRGDDVKLSLELVNTQSQNVIWSEQYDRKQADLVSLQRDIARDVLGKLRSRLSGADVQTVERTYTTNSDAYQAYLRGRYYWNRRTVDGVRTSIEEFRRSTELDPGFALGYVGLADSYVVLEQYANVPSAESLPRARAAVDHALNLDDSLAEAYASSGLIYQNQWKWNEAEADYRRAISLNPNYPSAHNWLAVYLAVHRRFPEAVEEARLAKQLDPLSPVISSNLALYLFYAGDLTASADEARKQIDFEPRAPESYRTLALIDLEMRRFDDAIANAEKAVDVSGRSSRFLSELGYCLATAGRRKEALEIAAELDQRFSRKESPGQYSAAIYAPLGDADKAFDWLEKDLAARSGQLMFISYRLYFASLRDDRRYEELLRSMGLSLQVAKQ